MLVAVKLVKCGTAKLLKNNLSPYLRIIRHTVFTANEECRTNIHGFRHIPRRPCFLRNWVEAVAGFCPEFPPFWLFFVGRKSVERVFLCPVLFYHGMVVGTGPRTAPLYHFRDVKLERTAKNLVFEWVAMGLFAPPRKWRCWHRPQIPGSPENEDSMFYTWFSLI